MKIVENNPVISSDIEQIILASLPWSSLEDKVIMVVGGAGFLASYLVKVLLAASDLYCLGLKLICVARRSVSVHSRLGQYLNHPELRIIIHNISDPLTSDFPPADIIIHSASQASPKYYGSDPVGTLMANTVGTINLLNHAVANQSKRFLFFSSGEVYGLPLNPSLPLTERDYGYLDPMQIRSCYAESKRIGETMCVAWSHQFGLHTNVVRPFHTYGPGIALDDGRVFADFVADVVNKRDIVLKSDGLAKRSFCYVKDAIEGFLSVLLKGQNAEVYNIANPRAEISMLDLAYTLAELFPNRRVGVRFNLLATNVSYIKSPISQSLPSIEKISTLGWEPRIGIKEGFARTIQSFIGT